MFRPLAWLVPVLWLVAAAPQRTVPPPPAHVRAERAEALRKHGLDPESSLESRIGKTPASVLQMFAEAGPAAPTPQPHELTAAERRKLVDALEALPPLQRRVLRERLRTVSVLDGIPNTALTSTVNPDEPYRLFDITLRAGILSESVSQFLTWKERGCFEAAGSSRSVSIEAGELDGVLYVLLHEASHVVDSSLGMSASGAPFVEGVWSEATVLAPAYRGSLLERITFRAGGEVLPIARAEAVYAALAKTPFVSLYASRNWHDDLAESVAWYHLAEKRQQPYRIVVRDGQKEAFTYEPLKSTLVRQRLERLRVFYEGDISPSRVGMSSDTVGWMGTAH
ncbi:MAG TPA: hypothetical protein VF310_08700 [Vicinamibacteria bacterium]